MHPSEITRSLHYSLFLLRKLSSKNLQLLLNLHRPDSRNMLIRYHCTQYDLSKVPGTLVPSPLPRRQSCTMVTITGLSGQRILAVKLSPAACHAMRLVSSVPQRYGVLLNSQSKNDKLLPRSETLRKGIDCCGLKIPQKRLRPRKSLWILVPTQHDGHEISRTLSRAQSSLDVPYQWWRGCFRATVPYEGS